MPTMPSDSASSGRYAQYKQKTDALVGWLARKASQCCNISMIVPSLPQTRRRSSAGARKTVELGTSQLLQLAEAIAAAKPPVVILPETLELVQEVIDLRQTSANEHAAESMKRYNALTTDDEGHQYFIEVLKKILALLESAHASSVTAIATMAEVQAKSDDSKPGKKKKGRAKKSKTTSAADVMNLVDELDLEQPIEEMQTGDTGAPPDSTIHVDVSQVDFKLEQQTGDLTFSLWCHLQDMHDVRKTVCESALEFCKGNETELALGMIAETAFALLKCADDAFCVSNPALDSYNKVLEFLGLEDIGMGFEGCSRAFSFLVRRPGSSSTRQLAYAADLIDLLCPAAAQLINTHSWNSNRLAQSDISKNRDKPTETSGGAEEVWFESHPLAKTLSCNVGRLNWANAIGKQGLRLDEFASELGFSQVRRTWLVVAFQIYMDLIDIIGLDCTTALATVKDSLSQLEKITTNWRGGNPKFPEYVRKAHRTLELETDAFDRSDKTLSAYEKQLKLFKDSFNGFITGMESRLPTNAAASAFNLKSHSLLLASMAANEGSLDIHCAAYLYKLARRLGLLQTEWNDMEFFISSQALEKPLIPKLGSSAPVRKYMTAFEASIGINLAEYIRLGKVPKNDAASKNAKRIEPGGKLLSQLIQVQHDPKARGAAHTSTGKTLEIILHKMTSEQARQGATAPLTGRKSMVKESFTPKELLMTFKKALVREEPILNFDVWEFTLVCRQIMVAIRDSVKDSLGSASGPVEALAAILILKEAQVYDKTGTLPQSAMIHRAVEHLSTVISSRGNEFVKKAMNQSSGHIPKDLRPKVDNSSMKYNALQTINAGELIRGGTTVGFTGKVISLYHPELTSSELERVIRWDAEKGWLHLPYHMFAPNAGIIMCDIKGEENLYWVPTEPPSDDDVEEEDCSAWII